MKKITQKRLKESLYYNTKTGLFRWRKDVIAGKGAVRVKAGSLAGHTTKDGYLRISIDGQIHEAGRLAWLYINGYLPENQIDHINQKPSDNKFKNLREVSKQCNARNYGNPKNNKTGVRGIYWYNATKKWQAYIMVNQKGYHLGFHVDFTEAVAHRLAAEQCLNWCNLNSPAYLYIIKYLENKKGIKNDK